MGEGPATGFALLALLGILGLPAPAFALVLSVAAFAVAVCALVRVNGLVKRIDAQNTGQEKEITELAADPHREGGESGD